VKSYKLRKISKNRKKVSNFIKRPQNSRFVNPSSKTSNCEWKALH